MTASRRPTGQSPTWVPGALAAAGILLGGCAEFYGYPGMLVTWLLVAAGAWAAPVAQFTGKKDASGYPTPAHPGEQAAMQRYRFWADLKWRLLIPAESLAPGWPPYASWLAGVWAAAAVWCLPHLQVSRLGHLPRHLDAAFAFVLVTQVAAARRRTAVAGDVSPGVRVDAVKHLRSATRESVVPAAAATLLGATLGGYLLGVYLPAPPVAALGPVAWYFLGALGGAAMGVAKWWVEASLTPWRIVCAAREEWAPRWQMLKHDPAPVLTARESVGAATVDTFTAPASLGAIAYWSLAAKVTPTMGAGQRIAIISTPNTDSQGQPVPGTRHPLQFQVVAWASDALPDVTSFEADPDEVRLLLQCAMIWAADEGGFARPILDEALPLAAAPGAGRETSVESSGESDGGAPETPPTGQRQSWGTTWLLPDGPPMTYVRSALRHPYGGYLGCEVLVDHRNSFVYVGGLTDGSTVFDPETGVEPKSLEDLAAEDVWNERWAAVLKQDVNPPTIEHSTYSEAQLSDGRSVFRQAFVTRNGVDPMDFFGLEAKISASMSGAPYVAVTGWGSSSTGDRAGERHTQAFTVFWSPSAVPANPDTLVPGRGRDDAARWVLAGRLNAAFKAARLAQPEMYASTCVTTASSTGHIWKMSVRLYGGVTLADVRGASQRLRQALGSEWLRVEAVADGCTIVAGASPSKVTLANPRRDADYLASLDWEQAWLDAKVAGVGGLTPRLVEVDHLPSNQKVRVLDFELPSGLAVGDIKAATKKLETSTANSYVDVRESPDGRADKVRILVCEVNPLPERVAFDFDVVDAISGIPFATGVEGEPVVFDPSESPHALLAGLTGAGKSVLAQNFLYAFLVHGAEVYVIDPIKGGADFQFAKPYAKAFADDPFQAAGVMKAVYAEVVRRKTLNAQHGVGSYRDLPEPPLPIVVMIDEFTSLMGQSPVPKPSDDPEMERAREAIIADNLARTEVGVLAGKLAREARSAGVTLLLGTQKLTAKMLDSVPGGSDLKTNLARVLLGKASFGDRASALRAFDSAPVLDGNIPKGRGLWESLSSPAVIMQCWFAPQETLAQNLAARISPLPESALLDTSGFLPPEPDVNGAVIIDVATRPAAAPVPDRVVDLGEIELSLDDLELTLDDLDDLDDLDADADDVEMDPATTRDDESTTGPVDGPVDFDWDAAEEAAVSDPDDTSDLGDDLDWSTATTDQATDQASQPASAHPAGEEDAVLVETSVVWDEIDPSPWEPAVSEFGWPEIEAVLGFLAEYPAVREITWSDPHLLDEDDLGVAYLDVVNDLLLARAVTLHGPERLAPVAADIEVAPAVSSVSVALDDFDDEFGPLPTVPAHLIPDTDPFA